MNIAVIGNGNVGLATVNELIRLREVDRIYLLGRDQARISGEVMDHVDAGILSLTPRAEIAAGKFALAAEADIILYAAGQKQQPGQDRLELAAVNVGIAKDIFSQIPSLKSNAMIIVLSNPVDVLTWAIASFAALPPNRIFGSGTTLDSARLKNRLEKFFEISARNIDLFVWGEHGNSAAVPWSLLRIAGMSIEDFSKFSIGKNVKLNYEKIYTNVRQSAERIIEAKGSTSYGIAAAACRLVLAIARDSREVFPVSVCPQGKYGITDCAVSLPCVIGNEGISEIIEVPAKPDELMELKRSADVIKAAIQASV